MTLVDRISIERDLVLQTQRNMMRIIFIHVCICIVGACYKLPTNGLPFLDTFSFTTRLIYTVKYTTYIRYATPSEAVQFSVTLTARVTHIIFLHLKQFNVCFCQRVPPLFLMILCELKKIVARSAYLISTQQLERGTFVILYDEPHERCMYEKQRMYMNLAEIQQQ